jgi:acyl-CoA synthetase (NDP forming)
MAYLAAPDRTGEPVRVLGERGVPVHPGIRAAIVGMAALASAPSVSAPVAGPPTDLPDLPAGEVLTEHAATPLLDHLGVPRPESVLVTEPSELPATVAGLGGRVVLKVQSPDVAHKSELGAVVVGVSAADALAAGEAMLRAVAGARPDAVVEGVLVQRMCPPGTELLVGVRAGAHGYPATVTVGIGGTTVELYGDVATAFAPLDAASAMALLRSLRGFPLLDGFRGRPPADVVAAADAVARLSQACAAPGLLELEVNPLIVHPAGDGVTAVDLLVRKETQ